MSQFSQKNMAGNIRSLLAINSTDLPKLQPIETLLWSAVQNALVNADDLIVELEWLGLGAQLSNILKKANAEVIGNPKSRTGWLYNQPAPYFLRLAAR